MYICILFLEIKEATRAQGHSALFCQRKPPFCLDTETTNRTLRILYSIHNYTVQINSVNRSAWNDLHVLRKAEHT